MDPWQMKKIESMKRYKRREALDNLYFYLVTAFACSLFCCVTLCLPYLLSLLRMLFVFIPSLVSMLMSSKLLFILGNLIIVLLIVDSRIFSSNSSSLTTDVYYEEYLKSRQTQRPARKTGEYAAEDDEQGSEGAGTPTQVDTKDPEENPELCDSDSDELNRRADDYIARVNKQRRLEVELSLVQCDNY